MGRMRIVHAKMAALLQSGGALFFTVRLSELG
jgi:hypothetical protein